MTDTPKKTAYQIWKQVTSLNLSKEEFDKEYKKRLVEYGVIIPKFNLHH